MQITNLTLDAQALLKRLASHHIAGKATQDLKALVVDHSTSLPNLHFDIQELVDANALRMERLSCTDQGARVRFHLIADPADVLALLDGGTPNGS